MGIGGKILDPNQKEEGIVGMVCELLDNWTHKVTFLAFRYMLSHNSTDKHRYRWTGTSRHRDINV